MLLLALAEAIAELALTRSWRRNCGRVESGLQTFFSRSRRPNPCIGVWGAANTAIAMAAADGQPESGPAGALGEERLVQAAWLTKP